MNMIETRATKNNILTISPGVPFLKTLAEFAMNIARENAANPSDFPFALSSMTIYLPTRRAVRTLRDELANQSGGMPLLLPSIKTLGDGEEDILMHDLIDNIEHQAATIPAISRQLILAKLVRQWVQMISEQSRELFRDSEMVIPSSSAEALWLASEVGSLIDQMETEEISWENLHGLVPQKDEYAGWWQLTLDFLEIATRSWPIIQKELGAIDASAQRKNLMNTRTQHLLRSAPTGPIIAAGSTGSIPATARFLKAISQLEQGYVILPGLDSHLSREAWEEISGNYPEDRKPAEPRFQFSNKGCEDHPQFGLSKLIETCTTDRDEVSSLGHQSTELELRNKLISIAMLPSQQTRHWRDLTSSIDKSMEEQALEGITLIEAPGERQEALAIALAMRHQLEIQGQKTALVTPDRNLARRVTTELKRFGLDIDDSGGSSLRNTPAASFTRLLISVTTGKADVVHLASFIKHQFFIEQQQDLPGMPAGRLFEICLLREALKVPQAGQFEQAVSTRKDELSQQSHIPGLVASMNDEDWQRLSSFARLLDEALAPLVNLTLNPDPLPIHELFHCLIQVLNQLQETETGIGPFLHQLGGPELNSLFEEILASQDFGFTSKAEEFFPIFDALIAGRMIRAQANTHPDLAIYGPLEARLQPMDCVILAALNEGSWPQHHDSGPFLSRPMKAAIELATPERRTGLSAHDFEQLMGTPKVILTRSSRVDNAPTVPSRWLQRLSAIISEPQNKQIRQRGQSYLDLANLVDQPVEPSKRVERPCPTPPVSARPTRLSITEIETWIRDPYAIYAKRILGLYPLGSLGTISEPALRGTILHDALAEFISRKINPQDPKAGEILLDILNTEIERNHLPVHLSSIWMPRFEEIVADFISFEKDHQHKLLESHVEIDGKLQLKDPDFLLHGRADRIDLLEDGSIRLLDYKTGMRPTIAMARTLAPQLALEGAIALAGGFRELEPRSPSSLEYIRLRSRGEFSRQSVNNKDISAEDLSTDKLAELKNLISHYQNPDQGYLSRFAVELSEEISGDYDHLARIREWSWGSEEAEAGGSGD